MTILTKLLGMLSNKSSSHAGRNPAKPRQAVKLNLEALEERSLLSVSAAEQLFIYDLNVARSNPLAYQQATGMPADLSGVAVQQPLAVNNLLVASAQGHATEMATNNYFGHQSAVTGLWPNQMARNQGYNLPAAWPGDNNYIESIAAGYGTAASALYALILDAGIPSLGHRVQLLATDPFFATDREIGVGHAFNASSTYQDYWSIQTAYVNPSDEFLTGVVYNDANSNGRYDLNEGLGGVTVTAGSFTTTTNTAGGWSIKVPAGSYTVSVSAGAFVGTANVTVTAGSTNVEVDFLSGKKGGQVNFVTVAGDNPPALNFFANQTMAHTQATLTVPFTASDTDGDTVTVSAQAVSLYQLKQQLGLSYLGAYYPNAWGMNEKWVVGNNSQWYCILPNGEFRQWAGSTAATLQPAALLATLDSSYYADPSLLWNALAGTVPVTVTVSANQLIVDPASNFAGKFVVQVSASDGTLTTTHSFTVTVTDAAPVLTLSDKTMKASQHQITVPLSASDADGDTVTFSALALPAGFSLGQTLGLHYAGGYYLNTWGMNEKWMLGNNNQYYCILPNGEVRKWTGATSTTLQAAALMGTFDRTYYANPNQFWNADVAANYQTGLQQGLHDAGGYYLNTWGMNEKWMLGNSNQYFCILPNGELRKFAGSTAATLQANALVATLNSFCYDDPSQLWNAPAVPAALSVIGNQLVETPASGFVGTLLVQITASDGMTASTGTFKLTVTNAAPLLMAIPNQTMSIGQPKLALTLSASDADGDPLTFSASAMSAAYQLDQQLGLNYYGSYYLNTWGMNEKWMLSSTNQWYCILPNGEVRQFAGSTAATLMPAALVTILNSSYYADPSLLWNASSAIPVTVSLIGNQLTIQLNGFVGMFIVAVTVSDGTIPTTQKFSVTVS